MMKQIRVSWTLGLCTDSDVVTSSMHILSLEFLVSLVRSRGKISLDPSIIIIIIIIILVMINLWLALMISSSNKRRLIDYIVYFVVEARVSMGGLLGVVLCATM